MFRNEALTDFTIQSNREALSSTLEKLSIDISAGKLFSLPLVAGKEIKTEHATTSFDPSEPSIALGRVYYAEPKHVVESFNLLETGWLKWRRCHYEERAAIIKKVAALMRERKHWLCALIIREAGKPWKEADADVAEAIDFCEFYGDEMLRLGPPQKTSQIPGEENIYFYKPRGIAVVIAPWNFPLAIACGMTCAALVSGNAVILKPAEQTSLIAFCFAKILIEAGVPADAFAFLPGQGEVVGRLLVEHYKTALICFTGSKAVGLEILSKAAVVKEQQTHIKKVIAELGGKNCIIVDEDADLDEAVKGVLYSAFGYAGQKCSACSRVVAIGDIYETFVNRLCEAAADLIIGPACDPSSYLGPVIDRDSQLRILSVIENSKKNALLAFQGSAPQSGYFVGPAIFKDVDDRHSLWTEEIFGPVLAIKRAQNFEEALTLANNSQYSLTGGVFSRSPRNISRAYSDFEVGNLYVNRSCTGAMVGRQPFGGSKLSGVGSKAGGRDYLLQFLEPISICENSMRRGFAPEV